jgi:hypothetical protein
MLGHASALVTLDIYADLFDDDLEAGRVDQARSRESVGKNCSEPRFQPTSLATSTIAEVICAISSGPQMNGGIA